MLSCAVVALPSATGAFIRKNSSRIKGAIVLGGGSAVSASSVRYVPDVRRIFGSDRFGTNIATVRAFFSRGAYRPLVADADDFPDALVASVYAAKVAQPLLLVHPRVLPDFTREFVEQTARRMTTGFTMIGSTSSSPALMDWELDKAYD